MLKKFSCTPSIVLELNIFSVRRNSSAPTNSRNMTTRILWATSFANNFWQLRKKKYRINLLLLSSLFLVTIWHSEKFIICNVFVARSFVAHLKQTNLFKKIIVHWCPVGWEIYFSPSWKSSQSLSWVRRLEKKERQRVNIF